jgi:hypothetical protein
MEDASDARNPFRHGQCHTPVRKPDQTRNPWGWVYWLDFEVRFNVYAEAA